MSRSARQAFTLIELLVVISIIALLISLLAPSLSAAREHSRSVVCRTNLRELARCEQLYCCDYGVFSSCIDNYAQTNTVLGCSPGWNFDVPGLDWLGISSGTVGWDTAPQCGLLWKYIQNPALILCPSDYYGKCQPNELVGPGNGKFSYTMDAVLGLRAPERIPAIPSFVSRQISPSVALMFVEEHPSTINGSNKEGNFGAWPYVDPPLDTADDHLVSRHGPFTPRPGVRPGENSPSTFLQGTSNVGFADGHVDALRPNFGFDGTQLSTFGNATVPNTHVGLLRRYGVRYQVLPLERCPP